MPPFPSRDHLFKRVVICSLTSPLSLFLGTVGLLLAASPVTWPLGIAALAADLVWIWSRIRDPRYVQASSEQMLQQRWRELIHRLEELSTSLDRETAGALAAIAESQERLVAMYEMDSPAPVPAVSPRTGVSAGCAVLPHTRLELIALSQHCLSLAGKKRQLQGYLLGARSQDVQRQAAQLELRLEQAPDPVTRRLYEQALDQKRQELENYVRVGEAVARIDGQLAAVQCTFDNLWSRLVRLQSVGAAAGDPASEAVYGELNRLKIGIAALEAGLNETLSWQGTA